MRALKWIQEHKSIEAGIQNLDKKLEYVLFACICIENKITYNIMIPPPPIKYRVPDPFPYAEAAELFKNPLITLPSDIKVFFLIYNLILRYVVRCFTS